MSVNFLELGFPVVAWESCRSLGYFLFARMILAEIARGIFQSVTLLLPFLIALRPKSQRTCDCRPPL